MTTLLTLFYLAAFITAKVPSTAGLIRISSFYGVSIGNGEAVWTTYVLPSIAFIIEFSSHRSASTSSSYKKYSPKAFFKGSIFSGLLIDLTVPLTLKVPFFKKIKHVYAPTYPEIPVIVTICLLNIFFLY